MRARSSPAARAVTGAVVALLTSLASPPAHADEPEIATAEPPPSSPPPYELTPARVKPKTPMFLGLDGGYVSRELFALSITGSDFGLGLGGQPSKHFGWWVVSRGSYGTTDNGVAVWTFRLGAEIEAVVDPVRFGLGVSGLAAGIERAARNDTINGWGVEGRLFMKVDLFRTDDYAMFLRGSLDAASVSGAATWGPAIGLGMDLGIRAKRPDAWK